MADIQRLASLIRELEDQLVVCMRCGLCQAVCPLYAVTGREADVARGKLALLNGLMQALFDDPSGASERLSRCLLCGSCAANCPSGVSVLEIFIKARAILAGVQGLSAAKKLVLRGMLARPRRFDGLVRLAARFQPLLTRPLNPALGTSCARLSSPLLEGRHFKALADEPFHARVPHLNTPPGTAGFKVAFFVGCLIDKLYPQIADAVVRVTAHHGIGLLIPANQGCCGIPAVSAGDAATVERLMRHNLALFEDTGCDYLVTACATCTATLKEIWPLMVPAGDPGLARRVAALADATRDINQLLVERVALEAPSHPPGRSPRRVTYHDPCHLKKGLGVFTQPRRLLAANRDYQLHEMTDADRCCGLGGSFNLQYYDLSTRIGRLKGDAIRATGAEVVATGCPACMLQLADVLSQSASNVVLKHPIEIYAEHLP